MTRANPCPDHEQLARLLNNQLSSDEELALTAHIDQCPACQQRLHDWAFTDDSWKDVANALQAGDADPDPLLEYVVNDFQVNDNRTVDYETPNDADGESGPPLPVESVPTALGLPPRYHMADEIARGGMGAILRGHDAELGRDIAVKVMLETHQGKTERLQRFVEEAQIGGQLQHPGIVPIYDFGRDGDKRPYFTMKLIKGQTLAAQLKGRDHAAHDLPRFLGIFEQICQTLAYAHAHGVIHRDLKPANIMVGNFGEVQVMDWGLAKVLPKDGTEQSRDREEAEQADDATAIRTVRSGSAQDAGPHSAESGTRTGSVLGTPAYMPPEQAKGEIHELDERCDVFGLGAILCVILTGKPPYVGKDTNDVHRKAMAGDLIDALERLNACDTDAVLVDLTKQCLAVKKEDRPRNAGKIAEAVKSYLQAVQARLQQAKIEAAQANVRAEAEHKQRQLAELAKTEAEGKAVAEKMRRRATAVMAVVALLLISVIGLGGLAAWQQSSLEQKRYTAGIQKIYELLGRYRLKEAKKTHVQLFQGLGFWTPQTLKKQLERAKADIALMHELDNVRLDRANIVDGTFADFSGSAAAYEAVFQKYELRITDQKSATEVANKLRGRHRVVKEYVVAALDDWGNCLKAKNTQQRWLLKTARELDQEDAVRTQLRQPHIWNDPKAVANLSKSLDVKKATPHLLVAISRRLLFTQGNLARVQFLARAQAHHPNDFWLLFSLGAAYSKEGEIDLAIGCYRAALVVRPNVAVAYFNWGLALAKKKDYDGAIEKYQRVTEIAPKNPLVYSDWGVALAYYKKDYDGAIAKYQHATQLDPNYALAYLNWGYALYEKEDLDGAIDKYQLAAQLNRKDARVYYNWGQALYDKKDLDGAIAKFQKVTQLDPKHSLAYYQWGHILHRKEDLDGAIDKYQFATKFNRKDARVYYSWGQALYDKKDLDGAINKFWLAAQVDPKFAVAYSMWGIVLHDKKDFDGAIAKFQKVTQLDRKDAKAYYNWGLALAKKKDYDGAIDKFRLVPPIDPKYPDVHHSWGLALANKKDYDGAIEMYRLATQINPKDAEAYSSWGLALAKKKDYDGAIDKYQHATKFNRKDARVCYYWGRALHDKKDFDGAIEKYTKATQINSHYAEAYCMWGVALAKKRDLDGAIKKYTKATQINSKDAVANYNWGLALGKKNDLDGAIAKFQLATQINSDYAQAYSTWGFALSKKKDLDGAIEKYKKAAQIDPNHSRTYNDWGVALAEKKDLDSAIAKFQWAIVLQPKYAHAGLGLGDAFLNNGQFVQAAITFQTLQTWVSGSHPFSRLAQKRIQVCQTLMELEKKIPDVLLGKRSVSPQELLVLASLCQRYKKRYRDAAHLYSKLAESLKYPHRYNATCCAILAAAGKGKDASKLSRKAKNKWRRQAMTWLKADLELFQKELRNGNPSEIVTLAEKTLPQFQTDADLAAIRKTVELAKLPKEEHLTWHQLWFEVERLRILARASYTGAQIKGMLTDAKRERTHGFRMTAGKTYVIDMQSKQFDTFLRLQDAAGKLLAENDDINLKAKNLNSRIVFSPKESGTYHLIATSYQQRGRGAYEIIVREFTVQKHQSGKPSGSQRLRTK